jgi:hypothetical protein
VLPNKASDQARADARVTSFQMRSVLFDGNGNRWR